MGYKYPVHTPRNARAACLFLVALWLAALYGLVGDLEGFERWREWFERRRD
jgi:hypothetical protein